MEEAGPPLSGRVGVRQIHPAAYLNWMYDLYPPRRDGEILLNGKNVLDPGRT